MSLDFDVARPFERTLRRHFSSSGSVQSEWPVLPESTKRLCRLPHPHGQGSPGRRIRQARRSTIWFDQLRGNVIALPPNVVIIDGEQLALVTCLARLDVAGLVRQRNSWNCAPMVERPQILRSGGLVPWERFSNSHDSPAWRQPMKRATSGWMPSWRWTWIFAAASSYALDYLVTTLAAHEFARLFGSRADETRWESLRRVVFGQLRQRNERSGPTVSPSTC